MPQVLQLFISKLIFKTHLVHKFYQKCLLNYDLETLHKSGGWLGTE